MLGFAYQPRLLQAAQKIAERNIANAASRIPQLRAAVTPTWQIGCKRILISNDWYPMLARDDVDLVTDGIAEIRPNAIVTTDGTVREVDAIVVATGFHVTDSPTFERIVGADGRSLGRRVARQGPAGLQGRRGARLPEHVLRDRPEHRPRAQLDGLHGRVAHQLPRRARWTRWTGTAWPPSTCARTRSASTTTNLQDRMGSTIWTTGGCASWYLDAHGNNTTLWPELHLHVPAA